MKTAAFRSSHIETSREKETAASNLLAHWILVGCDAYDEYVFAPSINESYSSEWWLCVEPLFDRQSFYDACDPIEPG
ncbi:hypothetical protein P3T23_004437 [Paraburkholderia sp. GAS448]